MRCHTPRAVFDDPGSSDHDRPSPATPNAMPRRFLCHDETETFRDARRRAVKVRIRIWLGTAATPIALVSQVPGEPHPAFLTTRLANYIHESLLQYPSCGFIYYESGTSATGDHCLFQQLFEYFGHKNRYRLFKPEGRRKSWSYLEDVIGCSIDK